MAESCVSAELPSSIPARVYGAWQPDSPYVPKYGPAFQASPHPADLLGPLSSRRVGVYRLEGFVDIRRDVSVSSMVPVEAP